MKVAFVAGFGPIVPDTDAARRFWGDGLGIGLDEAAPGYFTNDDLDGVRAFALWPLSQAAESTFGTETWPDDLPTPQAWIELDLIANAADVHCHSMPIAHAAPEASKQLVGREYLAWMLGQKEQHIKFTRRQCDRSAVDTYLARQRIDRQPPKRQRGRGG